MTEAELLVIEVLTKWAGWADRGAKEYRTGEEATPFPSMREHYRREAEDREEFRDEARHALKMLAESRK